MKKVGRRLLRKQLEEIIEYGVTECEEIEVTASKIMLLIQPLIDLVEAHARSKTTPRND